MSEMRVLLAICVLLPLAPWAAAAPAPTAPASTQRAIPIVYAVSEFAKPLKPEQIAEVERAAAAKKPKGSSIWMILVRLSYEQRPGLLSRGGWLFTGIVYYSPEFASSRIRKGWCATLGGGTSNGVLRVDASDPLRYAQVSPAGETFAATLSVPEPAYFPFTWPVTQQPPHNPVKLTDVELITVADMTRAALRESDLDVEPVSNVEKDGDLIYIYTGWGSGTYVCLRRVDGKYKVEGHSLWAN